MLAGVEETRGTALIDPGAPVGKLSEEPCESGSPTAGIAAKAETPDGGTPRSGGAGAIALTTLYERSGSTGAKMGVSRRKGDQE